MPCVHAAAKGNDVPVLPHIGCTDVAGINGQGKAHVETTDEREIVFADRLQNCVTGDSIGTSAVQNRCIESLKGAKPYPDRGNGSHAMRHTLLI